MSPEAVETLAARLQKAEVAIVKLEERVEVLNSDVKALVPLVVTVAEMKITLARIERLQEEQIQRREEERKDARRSRNAMVLGLSAALLTPLGAVIAAVIQNS